VIQARKSVAIIGSFRQHYKEVLEVWKIFSQAGIEVTSPKGAKIMDESIPFVRFETDASELDDHSVQSLALHRILRADLTFVVAPSGYIGRTTCYEIGRIIQAGRPLYFSEHPLDLPITIPESHIIKAEELARKLLSTDWEPTWLYNMTIDLASSLERELINGNYRLD
jgi:hypothetical protein